LVADLLYGISELPVGGDELVEILLADFHEIGVLGGANCSRPRAAAEQDIAEGCPTPSWAMASPGVWLSIHLAQDIHRSARDDIEGIAGSPALNRIFAYGISLMQAGLLIHAGSASQITYLGS
jgi:hypothetical protein